MLTARISRSLLVLVLAVSGPAVAQQADSSILTLERIYQTDEFSPQFPGAIRWMSEGDTYTKLQRVDGGGQNLVRFNAATGDSTVLVSAS